MTKLTVSDQTLSLLENLYTDPMLLLALIVMQAIAIVSLMIRKQALKKTRQKLKEISEQLEEKVNKRTEKLNAANEHLFKALAKHDEFEEELHKARTYLNSIINSMPIVLIGVSREGLVTHWNSHASQATGLTRSEVMDKPLDVVYPNLPISMATVVRCIDDEMPQSLEKLKQGEGEESQYLSITIYPLISHMDDGAVILIDDVTLRVKIEQMMIQNEKMMSLGGLAAGMAHEINNPLSAILNGVQNIERRTSVDLPANQSAANQIGLDLELLKTYMDARGLDTFLAGIREAGERAAKIVSNMLAFSRTGSQEHAAVDVKELLENAIALAENAGELRSNDHKAAKITTDISFDLPPLECSGTEIQQVVLNLLRNACQAFEPRDGVDIPEITLSARRENSNIRIIVADNAGGMSDDVRHHIFEPFFTTKDVGQGTGLGLSVSYFIVTEHHGGSIDVESTPGEGSRFVISLPLPYSNGDLLAS